MTDDRRRDTTLNDADRALLSAPNFASLATVMADGGPQASVVWIHVEDDTILVNTAEGRTKSENMRRDPRVAICLFDRHEPYRQLMLRGHVTGFEHEGADAHIDFLAKKYTGADVYDGHRPDQQRVIVRIAVDGVVRMGY
ncbi:MAG TPA: PPOX class F420-dependent oxidoreductase [Actinomycetota bacterium]|nr:PPOX class F420-dependent oxidoreductase [Actinomycetota bacterium]